MRLNFNRFGMAILLGFVSQNALAMARSIDFCDPQSLGGPPPLFSAKETQEIMEWDEKNHGVGNIIPTLPQNLSDIFLNGVDIPASQLNKRAQVAVQKWRDLDATEQSMMAQNKIDPSLMQNLNIEAHELWLEMLSCAGGDAEKMRVNYFKGQPCGSVESSAPLLKKIKVLQKGFIEALYSGPLFVKDKPANLSGRENLYNRCLFSGDRDRFALANIELPMFHPLLSQVLVQSLAAVNNTYFEKLQQSTLDMMTVDDDLICEQIDMQHEPVYKNKAAGEAKNYTKLVVNIFILLNSQSRAKASDAEACSVYGMWPLANRANMYGTMITRLQNISFVDDFIRQSERRLNEACTFKDSTFFRPRISPLGASSGGIYSRVAVATIFESKRLFATYFEADPKQSQQQLLKQNLKEAPFEALTCK